MRLFRHSISIPKIIHKISSKRGWAMIYSADIYFILLLMTFLICEKHGKTEKAGDRAMVNGHICMNRYCSQSFKVFCSGCKNEHKDHSNKVLTLEDLSFLLGRLLKSPPKQMTKSLSETLAIMKKLKFIKQFRKKIDLLEKEIQKYSLELITQTESILQEFTACKDNANSLEMMFNEIDKMDIYKQFLENSKGLLSNLDYNPKKDKLELGNNCVRQKQEKMKKTLESTKCKIDEVRDYSMKIIQVVFHNEDSEEEEEDVSYKKKHYEVLKAQLYLKNESELNDQIEDLKNSRSTASKSRIRKDPIHQQCQTQGITYTAQQFNTRIEQRLAELKQSHSRSQIDYKHKLHAVAREKENLSRELTRLKEKFDEKRKSITHIESQLRYNRGVRSQNVKMRQDLMSKFIEIWPFRCPDSEDKDA